MDPDLKYAIDFERQCIADATDLNIARFRRHRLRYTFDVNPTDEDRKVMKLHGSKPFRMPFSKLRATQTLVNADTVQKYVWRIREKGVFALALPFVELVKGELVVVDGHHRIEAFRRLGRKSVLVQYHRSNW